MTDIYDDDLTCVRHHGEASEHVCDDVDDHSTILTHPLSVSLSAHEVGAGQVGLYHSIPT